MRADSPADSPPDLASAMWPHLLDAIAAGGHRMVLETATGGRVVLLSEAEVLRLEDDARSGRAATTGTVLTARESEVLRLVDQGLHGAEIAARLGLSTNTVAQHLTSARRKYGVRSSAAAAAAARQAGHLGEQG